MTVCVNIGKNNPIGTGLSAVNGYIYLLDIPRLQKNQV